MFKNRLSKIFVLLSLSTLIALFFSIVSQSYDNLIRATTEIKDNPITRNISPDLDLSIIDEIEKRQELAPLNFFIVSPPSAEEISKEAENKVELIP